MKIELKKVKAPEIDVPVQTVLSDETMLQRRQKIANKMKDAGLDYLVVYGDLEHGSNFEYLTGFLTRFEESLLVLSEEGDHLIAGNENLNKAVISRLPVKPHHYSLPLLFLYIPPHYLQFFELSAVNRDMRS